MAPSVFISSSLYNDSSPNLRRRDGRVAEGARLESVFRGNSNVGSNPTLSARLFAFNKLSAIHTVKPTPGAVCDAIFPLLHLGRKFAQF
jgi:hypothetical protein